MWTIRGSTVSDATEPNASVNILNFRASQYVSEADFNNLSNQFGIVFARTSSISDYTATGSHSGNLLAYNRFNILHPAADNTWEYDGCYYTWLYETVGSDDYKFKAYRLNNNTYTYATTVTARLTQGDIQLTVPKSRIKSAYLIATSDDNTESGVGVCRILWHADLSFNGNFSQYPDQWWLGPAIPQSTIEEWLRKTKEDDDDEPDKPNPDPQPGDQQDATTTAGKNITWLNKFKLMLWPDDAPWPNKTLLEASADGELRLQLNDICAYNDNNDTQYKYHYSASMYNQGYNLCLTRIQNINNEVAEYGSNLAYYHSSDGVNGKFIIHISELDNPDNTYVPFQNGTDTVEQITLDNGFKLNNTASPIGENLMYLTIEMNGKTFNVDKNYSKATAQFGPGYWNVLLRGVQSMQPLLVKYQNHYYIAGPWLSQDQYNDYHSGFVVLCRIDDLQSMPNYGGANAEDPQPTSDPDDSDGLGTDDLDDGFGSPETAPNPTTDKEANDNIGDSPDNDGSSKDEDGNDRDPANNNTPGTGEKNTNPVNSHTVVNIHDGSMGNGTGDPHQDDTEITDPSTTMPTTAGDEGTVTGSGVLSVFTPTQAELTAFTSELLSSTVLDSIKNFFTTNPMDGIFSLHILPYTGFAGAATAAPRIGTHTFTATLTMAANEFITVDYGTVFVPFVYDGYENFAPNSDVKIFLPFIGTKDIDINVIQGCQCTLKYNVSLVTGDIYAYMYCKWAAKWGDADNGRGVDHLVYSWQGNCAATVPLSHLDSTNYISGAMQTAGGITSLVAGTATGNPFAIPSGIAGVTQGVAEMGRTSIITSGNISGMAAFMGCREPFFIFSRPIIAFNSHYNHYLGQRSNAIETIGSLRDGTFTMMRNVDLTGVSATSAELSEIEAILKGGFYI